VRVAFCIFAVLGAPCACEILFVLFVVPCLPDFVVASVSWVSSPDVVGFSRRLSIVVAS
jgi:hypothetical protein